MKNYINYTKESKQEDYESAFIESAYLYELEIKFSFDEYTQQLFFFNKDELIFDIDKYSKTICTNDDIWNILLKDNLLFDDVQHILKTIANKYFKLKGCIVIHNSPKLISIITSYFN